MIRVKDKGITIIEKGQIVSEYQVLEQIVYNQTLDKVKQVEKRRFCVIL